MKSHDHDTPAAMTRRNALHVAVSTGAASLLASSARGQQTDPHPKPKDSTGSEPLQIIDTNVHLFHWPFRRLPLDELELLLKKYRALGITQAWTGSFEALLHRDLAAVNERLAATCERHAELVAIGSINPALPGWEQDLQRCIETHRMPGVRLYPSYHGYTLADPNFQKVLQTATEAGRFVQVAVALEDTRTQHPLARVDDVDLAPLPTVLKQVAQARLQLLNYRPRQTVVEQLVQFPGVYFDIARVEGTDSVPGLMQGEAENRFLFGTHAPFLIPEAALIRLHESGTLSEFRIRVLLAGNARHLLQGGKS